jgi:hypothetical protein
MPTTPHSAPNKRIEKRIQKPDNPSLSPRIFGPRTFPSICCRMMINTRNRTHFSGETVRIRIAEGMAPRYGPKNGMILVTPTTILTSNP